MKEDSNPNFGLYFFPFSPHRPGYRFTKLETPPKNKKNHHPNHKNGRKDIVTSDQSKGKLAPQLQRSRNPTPPMPPHSTLKRLPAPIQPNDRLGSFPSPPLPNRAVSLQSPVNGSAQDHEFLTSWSSPSSSSSSSFLWGCSSAPPSPPPPPPSSSLQFKPPSAFVLWQEMATWGP